MLSRFEKFKTGGIEATKKSLEEFAYDQGYQIANMLERGNVLHFQVIGSTGLTNRQVYDVFCGQYNILERVSDQSQAEVVDDDDSFHIELDCSRY